MGATYLPLSSVTDPRVQVYASRADYITRTGGDPINNQPPIFDATKSVCMWSGPAGNYVVPRQYATNNIVLLNEADPVVPNIPGAYNWPAAPPIASTGMTYQYPGNPPIPVDPTTLCLEAQAIALAARILASTGVSLAIVEQPAPSGNPGTGTVQSVYNYGSEARRVWNLAGSLITTPATGTTPAVKSPVCFNAAALLAQESRLGVGYPGTWSFLGTLIEWLPGVNSGLPTAQTPPDLSTPIVLSPTQSVVALPPTMVLTVMDTAGSSSGSGSSDAAALQQILALMQQIRADVQKLGADLGDKTLA